MPLIHARSANQNQCTMCSRHPTYSSFIGFIGQSTIPNEALLTVKTAEDVVVVLLLRDAEQIICRRCGNGTGSNVVVKNAVDD